MGTTETPPKRSVSFADDDCLCIFHEGAVMELELSRNKIWYQPADMIRIKRKAMVVAKEAQRYGMGSLLTNTYGKCCEETQEALNTWVRNGNARRGLERWINAEYAATRADIRRRTIKSVLRAQSKMKEAEINDPFYAMNVISRLSEAFSVDSRSFARIMGIADEVAAKESCGSDCEAPRIEKCLPRTASPISVVPPRMPQRRNLALSTNIASDFRHFY